MTARRGGAKRAIAGLYSAAARRVYEPVVVRGAFPLLGGDLNALVFEQGRRAADGAGGGPILDMPVGTAYFTTALAAAHDGLVVGADLASGMVRRAREAAARAGAANLVAVRADAHALPFQRDCFAAVVCSNGLQVIPGPERTARELARVLAPGGTLFVSVVSLPLATVVPRRAGARLPALLRGRRDLEGALRAAGLVVTSTRRDRLALLLEARKPAASR